MMEGMEWWLLLGFHRNICAIEEKVGMKKRDDGWGWGEKVRRGEVTARWIRWLSLASPGEPAKRPLVISALPSA